MNIKDVMMLGEGSIVELDKNVGDEVDIFHQRQALWPGQTRSH